VTGPVAVRPLVYEVRAAVLAAASAGLLPSGISVRQYCRRRHAAVVKALAEAERLGLITGSPVPGQRQRGGSVIWLPTALSAVLGEEVKQVRVRAPMRERDLTGTF
jgi:hypothetical protein